MPVSKLAKLEDQRLDLIRLIEKCSPQGSSKNRVTVVFDGKLDVFGGMRSTAAKIIFSQGESADDTIRTIVAGAKNTKNIVVVTDDRDIHYAVGALGAQVISVREFLNKCQLPGKGKSQRVKRGKTVSSMPEKYISKTDESKITSELGTIWLKPNDRSEV